jgi:membrane-bound metal-dependent hydrolase YbcI (DUF457 family)
MPFTPFHLGPGAAFKAVGGRHFSFMVFGGAQVLMDVEPLVRILRGDLILHGYTHSIGGALLIGIVAALIGKPISTWVLERLRIRHHPLTWVAAFSGALVGTFSHVALDALMHPDMRPWWPLAGGNPLLGAIDVDRLHVACAVLGALGLVVVAAQGSLRRKT